MTKLEFALHILRQNSPFDDEMLYRILDGQRRYRDNCPSLLIAREMGEFAGKKSNETVDEKVFEDILYGMNDYIRGYRAIPAFKQKMWDLFNEWMLHIADVYTIENAKNLIDEIMEKPVEEDSYVTIIKKLHEGCSKKDIATSLCVSDKTVQNSLHLLDPNLDSEAKDNDSRKTHKKRNTPRFGGQILQVDITTEDRTVVDPDNPYKTKSKERIFKTKETLHPVALQLNVTQAGILLKGLQLANNMDVSDNSFEMAINVWTQLSAYCRKRLKEYYHPEDEDFHSFIEFIEEVEQDMDKGKMFQTEIEMFEDESIPNKLNLAFKGSRLCNVKLKDSKVLRKCSIIYDFGKYIIKDGERSYNVNVDDIEDILLYDD